MGRVLLVVGVVLALIAGAIALPGLMMISMVASTVTEDAARDTSGGAAWCQPDAPLAPEMSTSVTVGSLSERQVRAAHTIWTVAHQAGVGERGAIVGIATGMQESTLDGNPMTRSPNRDTDVGLMQLRALPGWHGPHATVRENTEYLTDYTNAARIFFEGAVVTSDTRAAAVRAGSRPAGPVGYRIPGLRQIDGWESMEVTRAAQAVQRSAYPTLYAKHEPLARQLVAAFNAEAGGNPPEAAGAAAAAVLCDPPAGPVEECEPSGLGAERGLTPDALRVLRCAYQQWPDLTYGGVRADSLPYHPSGRAIDIMTPGRCSPVGQQIADWARANREALGVVDVIWCQRIWSVARDAEGWRGMSDRGSATQNHMDHVHVTVAGNAARAPASSGSSAGSGEVVAPTSGYRLTARHNQRGSAWSSGYHTGLDFAAPAGTPVVSVQAGTVTSAGWGGAYGNLVRVDHGGGIASWYAHLNRIDVGVGDRVGAGGRLGALGWTGNVRPQGPGGAHLHLEIRRQGSPVDPDAWLASNGVQLAGSRA